MDKFDLEKHSQKPPANTNFDDQDSADKVVDIAIARMKADSVVKEERMSRFKLIAIAAACIAGLAAFGSLDFIYKTPSSETTKDGNTVVTLKQGPEGHYRAAGKINGERVQFLVDTGATNVAIPMSVAKRIGLPIGMSFQTMTANGYGVAYESGMKTIELGDIKLNGVAASVTEGLVGEEILLGMSFLGRTKVEQDKGVMTIT